MAVVGVLRLATEKQ